MTKTGSTSAVPIEGIVQLNYIVDDLDEAAMRWAGLGAGPFFHLFPPATPILYKGETRIIQMQVSCGWHKDKMIELCRPLEGPEHDGGNGLHHVAAFATDFDAATAAFEARGQAVLIRPLEYGDMRWCFIDTKSEFGHLLELYEHSPAIDGLYEMVEEASKNWDGRDPIRTL